MVSHATFSDLCWARPASTDVPVRTGVLVLDNSQGDGGAGRAAMLASIGVAALTIGWDDRPNLVPLEALADLVATVASEFDRVVLWGHGRGAEAALLVATRHPRVDGVIALAPSDRVREGVTGGAPVSAWTWQGVALPYEPSDAAAIAVEEIRGEVLCIAGGSDPTWPSSVAASAIESRRTERGQPTRVVIDSAAGHHVLFPAEVTGLDTHALDPAALQLGRLARPAVRRMLGISDLT